MGSAVRKFVSAKTKERSVIVTKIGCAILGSGNIGTDLMIKIQETSKILDLKIVIGLEKTSEGLAMARARGIATTH